MGELIESERLVFEAGSVEERAFALLHAHGAGEAKCALCLLAWLARALGRARAGRGECCRGGVRGGAAVRDDDVGVFRSVASPG